MWDDSRLHAARLYTSSPNSPLLSQIVFHTVRPPQLCYHFIPTKFMYMMQRDSKKVITCIIAIVKLFQIYSTLIEAIPDTGRGIKVVCNVHE